MEWLVTWLWQGCLMVGVVAGLLRAARSTTAATRHLVWCLTLAAVFGIPVVGRLAPLAPAPVASVAAVGTVDASTASLTLPELPLGAPVLMLGGWLIFAVTRIGDVAWQLQALWRRKRESRAVPPEREARLTRWRQRRGDGRGASLALSSDVAVASVLGLGRPLIVFPPALMTELTDEELDQVVLHEYAHIQRWDDWSNLAQVLVNAVCGWHPAVWWVTRELVQERELACDDWVIRHGGAPRPYLRGLAKVALLTARPAATALAPGAGETRGQLLRRVARVLRRGPGADWRVSREAGLLAGGLLAASVFWLAGLAPVVTFGRPDVAPNLVASKPLLASTGPVGGVVPLAADGTPEPASVSLDDRRPARASSGGLADGQPAQSAPPVEAAPLSPDLTVGLVRDSSDGARRLGPPANPLLRSREVVVERLSTERLTAPPAMAPAVIAEVRRATEESTGWGRFADAGEAVGSGFTRAGRSTAGAFTAFGSSVKRAFTSQ